jgi:hypothetical protein
MDNMDVETFIETLDRAICVGIDICVVGGNLVYPQSSGVDLLELLTDGADARMLATWFHGSSLDARTSASRVDCGLPAAEWQRVTEYFEGETCD